jgi:uncharacterized repeat protein (TIGR03803 family)
VYGGGSGCGGSGYGVVFKLSANGTFSMLHSFNGANDGPLPQSGLIADGAGNLYGTTAGGGSGCGTSGCGVVFKLSPSGTETVLYSFTDGDDGVRPFGGLIADSAGNLYGTTVEGGAYGQGVVFKLSGTGFVTATPFSAFQAALGIESGKEPNTDAFQLLSDFSLGQGSNGINPPAEPVALQIGTFSTTIPLAPSRRAALGRSISLGRSMASSWKSGSRRRQRINTPSPPQPRGPI